MPRFLTNLVDDTTPCLCFANLSALAFLLVMALTTGCNNQDLGEYKTFGQSEQVATAPNAPSIAEDHPSDASPTESQTSDSANSPAVATTTQPVSTDLNPAAGTIANSDAASTTMPKVRPETQAQSLRSDLLNPDAKTTPSADTANASSNAPGSSDSDSTAVSAVDGLASADATGAMTSKTPEVAPLREVKVLIPDKQFSAEGKDQALRVSYDDLDLLKVLNMEPVTDQCVELMPDWLKNLNGKKVRIRGFMYPTFEASGITEFVLARDNQICCFGRNPKVYDLIGIKMANGKTTNYIPNRPFDVTGTFVIEKTSAEGEIFGLYWIRDATITDR